MLRGVIANNIAGEGHRKKVKEAIEKFAGIEVLGTIPRNEEFSIKERSLGLITAEEGNIKVNMGIAYDNAFNFYYKDSLDLLKIKSCNISFFSPISDKTPPEGCDGLFFGGGYPEIFASRLSKKNTLAAFTHLHFASDIRIVENIVKSLGDYRRR